MSALQRFTILVVTMNIGSSLADDDEAGMDIGTWLLNLGLRQYESAFKENEIDYEVLPNLTSEDLKDLGVSFVGHRRKSLSAIADLSAPDPVRTRLSSDANWTSGDVASERRQLTL